MCFHFQTSAPTRRNIILAFYDADVNRFAFRKKQCYLHISAMQTPPTFAFRTSGIFIFQKKNA